MARDPVGMNGARPDAVRPTEHYRNLDDVPGRVPATEEPDDLLILLQEGAENPPEEIGIERADGSLIIRLDGKKITRESTSENAKKHDANLAKHVDERELARICDDLLNGI